jgi:hypothetical protein
MIPIAIKLFLGSALKRLLSGLTALLGVMRRYPWQAALIAALCLSFGLWRGNLAKDRMIDKINAELAETIKASQQAYAAQVALNKAAEAKSAAIAKETDDDIKTERAAASVAGDKYAAANRVRGKACVGRASETSASAENPDPGISEVTPAEALVAITRADFDKCTALYPYANGAYKWGVVLREAGLAE